MSSMESTPEDAVDTGAEGTQPERLALEVKIDRRSTCERHVTVTVSREDVDRYLDKAFSELTPKAEVPGFRPGRAPRKLVESRFREQIHNQVKGSLLMDCISQINEDHELSAISEPEFDLEAVTLPDEGPFTFEFDIEVRPEFDMPQWKGLQLARYLHEYSEEEVTQHLERLLTRYSSVEPVNEPAAMGDKLLLDLDFQVGGQSVGRHENVTVELKPILSLRDASVENFGAVLAGARAGEERQLTLRISDDSDDESLRGQEALLAVRLHEVRRLQLPELTPSFLDQIGGFEDVDDLRRAVREELERQLAYHQQQRLREQVAQQLTAGANWDLPPTLVRRQARRELERAVLELRAAGFSEDVIQAHANRLQQNSLATTTRALKEHFILERIAEEEKLDVEPDDYDREIELIARQRDEPPRRVRARLEKRGQMDALRNQIIERKTVELICSFASFRELPLQREVDDAFALDLSVTGGRDVAPIPEAKYAGEAGSLPHTADRE